MPPIDPVEFVSAVQPLLVGQDTGALVAMLHSRWNDEQIASLLSCNHSDARKVAALAMGLVGKSCSLPKLVPLLADSDAMVGQMAEHAIWSLWFRSGPPDANHELCRGSRAIARRDYEHAIEHFTRAIEIDPNFSEAYNQRAIAKYLTDHYEECIEDCEATIERMPCHFGAWAGMGHCHAHEGRFDEALRCYEQALAINPSLDGVRQAIAALRIRKCDDSGYGWDIGSDVPSIPK